MSARIISSSTLGQRPRAINNLNGESFQQDVLLTYNIYIDHIEGERHVQLSRRRLPAHDWESIVFTDHRQTEDDGHNVICIGVCHEDGSLHMSWDLHSSQFNYRRSLVDLVSDPEHAPWTIEAFGPVGHNLPGLDQDMSETTYPRFLSLPKQLGGALLLDLRTGFSGLGDEWLFVYTKGSWRSLGVYLRGVNNNAYINGLDLDSDGTLHVTWCYRDYVDAPRGKPQQAGPNGPENNHDLCYAYSPLEDGYPGRRWVTSDGTSVRAGVEDAVVPRPETIAFAIPKNSGILNQEAQCVSEGNVHVLNRENVDGMSTWFHYDVSARSRTALAVKPLSSTSARGKLVSRCGRVLALLQDKQDLVILDVHSQEPLCVVEGAGGIGCQEVLYDRHREDCLSLYLCINNQSVVVDVQLDLKSTASGK